MIKNKEFSKTTCMYISRKELLLGRQRGSEILAIGDWWRNTSDDIMEAIHFRSLVIKPVFSAYN